MQEQSENIESIKIPALDAILGKKFPVLDDGFIRVIDYMGGDEAIVQAARVSYGKGTKQVRQDRGLIRYLLRHKHSTPFEMCEIKLHIRIPMDAWRQWIRHRTANVNEYSTRYSLAIDSAQTTKNDEWRLQSSDNKQGSSGFFDSQIGQILSEEEANLHKNLKEIYLKRIEMGMAREQARKDLPLSTYTEAYWKIDLHNLLHFLKLRMDSHAQFEIRQYATLIGQEIVSKWVPITWEAFTDFSINSTEFSGVEMQILKKIIEKDEISANEIAKKSGWLELDKNGELKHSLERMEFEQKITTLGLIPNWKA